MSESLQIADDFALPPEAVTQTFALFGVRGSGKTYAALKIAEQMLKAGRHVVIFDPLGVCWGLRLAADGRGPGLPVYVLGGSHADLPLSAGSGRAVADLVMEQRLSVVLDLSLIEDDEDQARFINDFLRRLLFANRRPLHVIVDEAHKAAPQTPEKGSVQYQARSAMRKVVREGRVRGLGITLTDQRPQDVDKGCTSQCETLIALRLPGNLELNVVQEWVKNHGTAEQGRELGTSLPDLPTGEAWVVSRYLGLYHRIKFAARETYDSSATPTEDAPAVEPAPLSAPDLGRLREMLAETVAQAERDDPEALRRRIRSLEAQIKAQADQIATLEAEKNSGQKNSGAATVKTAATPVRPSRAKPAPAKVAPPRKAAQKKPARAATKKAPARKVSAPKASPTRTLPLPGLAKHSPSGELRPRLRAALGECWPHALTPAQLHALAGADVTDAQIQNELRALRRAGEAEADGEKVRGTETLARRNGRARPQTTAEWREMWRRHVGPMARRLLDALTAAHPRALTWPAWQDAAAYAHGGKVSAAREELAAVDLAARAGDVWRLGETWKPDAIGAAPALRLAE